MEQYTVRELKKVSLPIRPAFSGSPSDLINTIIVESKGFPCNAHLAELKTSLVSK
jgi:hypothetical protein